ncbi:MAG: TIGR00303 family protein [Cyanobacteria bacterium SZAS-4]|nr:TIGR00303 family protein [Cyanobacteria bacterium SZAS-4]
MVDSFLQIVNDERRMAALLSELQSNCAFYLCLGSTSISDVEGISAAGSTPQYRRLTPAADAEALVLGQTKTVEKLPVSPLGVVSPVVITRACLHLTNIAPQIVDCGAFVPPGIPHFSAGNCPADSVATGLALPLNIVRSLFDRGFEYGAQQSADCRPMIVAECVPGGTTTALAVLLALGYDAQYSLSGSIPNCNHAMRLELVEQGLRQLRGQSLLANPFDILAAVGDPMQPFVVGMALAGCRNSSIILAGGSQMLAVYALCAALAAQYEVEIADAPIGVITTKWVAFDPNARIADLSKQIGAPLCAASPDFMLSRHKGLQAYEAFNVKEGVGAGAAMALAYQVLSGDGGLLMANIDQSYDDMVGTLCST